MMFKLFFTALIYAALSSAAVLYVNGGGQCHADLCLRALRASQISTRLPSASADCAAYLQNAVSTATIYETVTISETAIATSFVTKTDTAHVTATSIVSEKTIVESSIVPTETRTITHPVDVQKRNAPSATIPAYASPCSGSARFVSACSCIGVVAPTTIPSTTITVSTTASFVSVKTVTESTAITTTDATKTQTEISTVISTVGGIATETLTVREFTLGTEGSDGQVYYLYWTLDDNGRSDRVVFTSASENLYSTWALLGDKLAVYDGSGYRPLKFPSTPNLVIWTTTDPSGYWSTSGFIEPQCSISDTSSVLQCKAMDKPYYFILYGDLVKNPSLLLLTSLHNNPSQLGNSLELINLHALPVPA